MDAHLQPASTFIYLANNREKKKPTQLGTAEQWQSSAKSKLPWQSMGGLTEQGHLDASMLTSYNSLTFDSEK